MLTTVAFLLYRLGLFSILFVQEAEASDFDDLGILLLAGFVLAVVVAVAVTVVRMKIQNKQEPPPSFISISSFDENDDGGS
jgi:hypothetical protein